MLSSGQPALARRTSRHLPRLACLFATSAALLVGGLLVGGTLACGTPAGAQTKGQPGHFDFYVLDLPWGPAFCSSIKDTGPACQPQHGFVVHGLWPQNNDGTWPVFCSDEPGPTEPRANLDITPDLPLLQHEWAKHGTCSDLGAKRFFATEHALFDAIVTPPELGHLTAPLTLTPEKLLASFYTVNPTFPPGSLLLSCRAEHLTAVEVCYARNLHPMPCLGLHSCAAATLTVAPNESSRPAGAAAP